MYVHFSDVRFLISNIILYILCMKMIWRREKQNSKSKTVTSLYIPYFPLYYSNVFCFAPITIGSAVLMNHSAELMISKPKLIKHICHCVTDLMTNPVSILSTCWRKWLLGRKMQEVIAWPRVTTCLFVYLTSWHAVVHVRPSHVVVMLRARLLAMILRCITLYGHYGTIF